MNTNTPAQRTLKTQLGHLYAKAPKRRKQATIRHDHPSHSTMVRIPLGLKPFIDLMADRLEDQNMQVRGTSSAASIIKAAVLTWLRENGGLPEMINGINWTDF